MKALVAHHQVSDVIGRSGGNPRKILTPWILSNSRDLFVFSPASLRSDIVNDKGRYHSRQSRSQGISNCHCKVCIDGLGGQKFEGRDSRSLLKHALVEFRASFPLIRLRKISLVLVRSLWAKRARKPNFLTRELLPIPSDELSLKRPILGAALRGTPSRLQRGE
jgi:hypothetical protein